MNMQIMDEVNSRANLAFSNNMEMLTFFLTDEQQYGINVFKIIEVIETPKDVTQVPKLHPAIVGTIDFRNDMVTVVDLSMAMDLQPVKFAEEISYIIICEYSNSTQGFLISRPNKLLQRNWGDVKKPSKGMSHQGVLTAITNDDDGQAIQILDIEAILNDVMDLEEEVSEMMVTQGGKQDLSGFHVMIVDDSRSALRMLENTLDQIKVPYLPFSGASEAIKYLETSIEGEKESDVDLIISDIEMPGMDGFSFCRFVKGHDRLQSIPLLLHSSMSNKANAHKADKVGADGFVPKFRPDEIARAVMERLGAI
uniref:Putative response regulator receiver modulated CheW protein n=1 Tax=Magnetococcus massalia (strain MO-1) TaxID=451514 RepID=A0A1S7LJP4_MAGMO|nr:Putative response regulator receiver modulated CheW protein [Candidatus Magnetococcus massalia]